MLAAVLLLSGLGFAEINITDCALIDTVDTYLLQNDLSLAYDYGYCFPQAVNGATLDCQGYTVNGNFLTDAFLTGANYYTVRNCNVKNFYGSFIAGEGNSYGKIYNNTFTGATYCMGGYEANGMLWENNSFSYVSGSCLALLGENTIVKNNYFSPSVINPVVVSPFDPAVAGGNKIMNNYFGTLPSVLSDADFNQWDISPRLGSAGILGNNILAGNYYNDDCDDFNCNGICDSPKVFNANNTDFYPLSYCDTWPITGYVVPVTPLTKLSETVSCSGDDLNTHTVFSYCGNTTCTTTSTDTSELCQYGCNSKEIPNTCNPSPFQGWLIIIAIIIIVVIVLAVASRRLG